MKEKLFSEVLAGSYESKHINNLCTKEVPEQIVRDLEKGCSLETLNEIAKDFPICKYKTQITIHGKFNCDVNSRIGIYKNVVKNQNGSLGVRWSAIDNDKKNELSRYVILKGWHLDRDSTGTTIEKVKQCTTIEKAKQIYIEQIEEAKKIDTSLFTGNVCVDVYCMFGMFYIYTTINLCCFPVDNMFKIAENLTGMNQAEIKAKLLKIKQDREDEKRRKEEASKKHKEAFAKWIAETPIPSEYVKLENYIPQEGDVICGHYDKSIYSADREFYVKFMKIIKVARTFYKTECDKDGKELNKYARIKLGLKPKIYKCANVKKANAQNPETKPQKPAQTRKPAQPSATQPQTQSKTAEMEIIDYSDRAIAVIGNTMQFVSQLKGLGGRYNARLTCGKGWIFPSTKREAIAKALNI